MDNRVLLMGGVAVVAIGAAFAAGHYINQPPAAPPAASEPAAPAPSGQPDETPAPEAPAEQAPAQQAMAPAPQAASPPTTAPAQVAPPKRVADYSSGEDEYAPPPPPPPPPPPREEFRGHPDPFTAHFNMFPMRHSGSGTIASPLTWTAQTALGNKREADLRISILVPEPPSNDSGKFWRKWGNHNQVDLMPDITRGTPVIVAGSASAVVTVDPEILDLSAPATLLISARDGQRVYRSRDVAPARGEAWDSRGARWIFVPDSEFYRMLRDGADASISVRSRLDGREIRIPFNTDDFPRTARSFEQKLSKRIASVATAWDHARPGRPMPPPVVAAPPPRANEAPDHDHDHGQGSHGDHGPQQPPASTTSPNGPDRGHDHGHDGTGPSRPGQPPATTPPAKSAAPAEDPHAAARAAMVKAYHPPADNCGAEPQFEAANTITPKVHAMFNAKKKWMGCEAKWIEQYKKSVDALGTSVADKGEKSTAALKSVKGGPAVIADYKKAHATYQAQSDAWLPQVNAYLKANGNTKEPGKKRR